MRYKKYRDTEVSFQDGIETTIKRVEYQEEETQDLGQTNQGLASIAYAKRADNEKGAKYSANFIEEDGIRFGIATTRSLR